MLSSMANIRYGKALPITNMQMIITNIGFRLGQSQKVKSNVLIHIGIQKPIQNVHQGDVADNKIHVVCCPCL